MVFEEKLDKVSHNAATEYVRNRLVIIGDGTGNLIHLKKRHFIVTCKHVAEPFFENKLLYAVICDNIRITHDKLKLIAYTKDSIDIAVIEIKTDITYKWSYNFNDFEVIENFSNYEWKDTFCFICGFPANLVFKNEKGYNYPYLSFTASLHKSRTSNADFIFLEYPIDKELKEMQSDLKTLLPKPYGISGSFILKVPKSVISVTEIWTPNILKVIAVVFQWNEKGKFIQGSNITHLIKLFESAKIL
jgi:hypothetical protein